MNIAERNLIAVLSGLGACLVIMAVVLPLLKRLKAKQEILSYVKLHEAKSGTATMGGIGIVLAFICIGLLLCGTQYKAVTVTLVITAAYAVVGFLDDYIKIRYKRNLGLTATQKAVAQLVIAVAAAVFVYTEQSIGTCVRLPFSGNEIDVGVWIIPLAAFVFLGGTNGVNLTDGLDGLASSVTLVVSVVMSVVLALDVGVMQQTGFVNIAGQYESLSVLCCVMVGCLLAFLVFNCNPASVFMGDTGSMALGAFIVCVSIFSRNTLLLAVVGIVYVITVLSVILQVLYFKLTKGKRLFLMSPVHHHFQMKGLSETRIGFIYSLVTLAVGITVIIFRLNAAV